LNWALGREGVTSVLCGAASVIELAANLKAARETIPLAQAETGLAPCRSTEAFRRFEAEMMKAGLNPPDWGGV
jgi:aryl-alcohol dehydrogenase-like predicted oxidoreductase